MAHTNNAIGGGGFHHVAIKVKDFDKSVKFYSDVLGFVPKISWGEGDGRAVMLDTGDGNYIEIFAGGSAGPQPESSWLHVAIRTSDTKAALERVRKAGMPITMEVTDITIESKPPTPIRIAFFKGPDGETLEFFEHR